MEEPERVSNIIGSLLREMGSQDLLVLSDIDRRWPEIVGNNLASRVKPLKLVKGTLWLGTPSPVWSQEVMFARETIKNRVKEVVGFTLQEIRTAQVAEDDWPQTEDEGPGTTQTAHTRETNRDALTTLQRAKDSYERAKARKSRR